MDKSEKTLPSVAKPYGPYRAGNGVYLLKSLFFETAVDKSNCVYTLKNEDHTVDGVLYPSLYRRYMAEKDVTEFIFANNHLAGWEHWEKLCRCEWFQDYLARWRKEVTLSVKSEALQKILQKSNSNAKDALMAQKFIVTGGWDTTPTKGRPSKEDIKRAANEKAEESNRVNLDFQRIISGNNAAKNIQ